MREIAPCKGCTERYIACHDHCDRYKAWAERYRAQKEYVDKGYFPESPARRKKTNRYIKFTSTAYARRRRSR